MKSAIIIIAVLFLMNAYVALSMRMKLCAVPAAAYLLAALFIPFFALQTVVPLFDWSRALVSHGMEGESYSMAVRYSYLAFGIMSCLLFFTILVDVFWIPMRLFMQEEMTRKTGLYAVLLVISATALSVFQGSMNAGKIEIARVEMRVKNLPAAFDGFKIAQISDLHVSHHKDRDFVFRVAAAVRNLDADAIALTGDIADGRAEEDGGEIAPLASLSAPSGKYYVTGNHEYYWGADGWIKAVSEAGYKVLQNEHAVIEKNGEKLVIAGVPDRTSFAVGASVTPDHAAAVWGAPEKSAKILLSHQPKFLEGAVRAGFDAQISGHTHAGQYFPFTQLIRFVEPYYKGLYDFGGMALYVNRGTGFWGPPLRERAGEITLITLRGV